ncbi:MAG: YihY/virulence factor BrkB family protein [Actinomycetota bacterium]|nr:YihY/virulence factor BrkB family protein [Actinomycetota bacterium]
MSIVARIDRYQREHSWSGLPLAVAYKVFDDRAPYLAALVTYYALVSLFPLMLLMLSVTGFVLDGYPGLRDQVITAAVDYFPAIGDQLRANISGFSGSGAALAVGVVGTLYGALGVMQAAQAAFNQMYGVPRNEQPNPFTSRLRSLGLVALLGVAVLVSSLIASVLSFADSLPWSITALVQVAGYALTWLLDVGLFTAGFQLLTARDLKTHDVLTGGLLAGSVFMLLQVFGPQFVSAQANRGGALYGTFGVILATIAYVYLQALAVMVAAEVNVVLHLRLWPRSLLTPFTDDVELTAGDRRAYSLYATAQRFKGFETVHADFTRDP